MHVLDPGRFALLHQFLSCPAFLCSQAFSVNSSFASFPPENHCTDHLAARRVVFSHYGLHSCRVSSRSRQSSEFYRCFIPEELRYTSPLIPSSSQFHCALLEHTLITSSLCQAHLSLVLPIQLDIIITNSIQPYFIYFVLSLKTYQPPYQYFTTIYLLFKHLVII